MSTFPLTLRSGPGRSVGVLVIALALTLAACGGDDDGSDTSTGTTGASTDAALGPVKPASGEPVRIGFVSSGLTAATDTTDEIKAAQAVQKYANKHLGGINGRPLEFVMCEEKGTPAGAADCAQTFIKERVAAVNSGTSAQIGTVIKAVSAAGIPTLAALAAAPEALADPNAFVFGNPLAPFGGAAAFAREQGNKTAAVLVIDVPGASGPAKQLAPVFFENAGAEAKVVAVPPGTADMTPQVQAAGQVDQFHVIGDPTFCAAALKAIKTLGVKADITVLDRCISPQGAQAIPGGFTGATIISSSNLDPASEEGKLYQAVLSTFGDGLKPSSPTASGYQGALGMVRALNSAALTDYTSAGVVAAMRRMPATPFPLGGGATFRCDGTALSVSKNVCSTFGAVADAAQDGTASNYRTVNAEGIYVLPKS